MQNCPILLFLFGDMVGFDYVLTTPQLQIDWGCCHLMHHSTASMCMIHFYLNVSFFPGCSWTRCVARINSQLQCLEPIQSHGSFTGLCKKTQFYHSMNLMDRGLLDNIKVKLTKLNIRLLKLTVVFFSSSFISA